MTNKKSRSASTLALDLTSAVDYYIQQGGVIHIVPMGETAEFHREPSETAKTTIELEDETVKKVELLKGLVARGAGVSSLQYTLRMNRKDVRRMAAQQGLKISYSRPIRGIRGETTKNPKTVDDELAGQAMHYSSLGFTALEIAQMLDLSVRQVWQMGVDYRFEFKQKKDRPDIGLRTQE